MSNGEIAPPEILPPPPIPRPEPPPEPTGAAGTDLILTPLTIHDPHDRLPMESFYEDRQRQMDQAAWDRLLEAEATAAEQMPKTAQPTGQEIPPEILQKTEADLTAEPNAKAVLDRVLQTFTGQTWDAISKAIKEGTLGEKVSMRLMDPGGNVADALIREQAKTEGLSPELTDRLATTGAMILGGITGGFFSKPGQAKKAASLFKVGKQEGPAGKTIAETLLEAQPGGEIRLNLERVGGTAEIKQAMGNISAALEEQLKASRRRIGHEATLKEAGKFTLGDVLGPMDESFAAKVAAVRNFSNAATSHATDLAKKVMAGDEAAKKELYGAFAIAMELGRRDELLGRTAARGLEIRKVLSEADRAKITPEQLSALSRKLVQGAGLSPEDLAISLLGLESQAQREGFIRSAGKAFQSGSNAIYEVWINWLLSGPQTHVANIVSNMTVIPVAIVDRAAAARVGQVLKAFGLSPGVEIGEADAMLYAMPAAAQDGFRMMAKFWKLGESFGGEKVERVGAFTADAMGVAKETWTGKGVDYLGNTLTIGRMPTKLMTAEDAFFKGFNYRLELEAQAFRMAKQEGLTGQSFAEKMGMIIANPERFPEVDAAARQFALIQTFNNEMGPVGKALMRAADLIPGGRVVAPFVRTPTNILTYWKAHSPLAPVGMKFWQDIAAGGAARDLAIAQMSAGSLLIAAIIPFALNGTITPHNPQEPNTKKALRGSGGEKPGCSIHIGNTYVALDRFDPLGWTLCATADYVQMAGQIPEGKRLELAAALILAVRQNIMSKTYLQGVANFVDAMQSSDKRMEKWIEGLARSTVPTGVRTITRTLDPTLRATDGVFDQIRAGIPGLSATLPPLRNRFADPILLEGGLGPDLISPFYTMTKKDDPIGQEIDRVGVKVSWISDVYHGARPPLLQMQPQQPSEGVQLTLGEKDRRIVLSGLGGKAPVLKAPFDESFKQLPTLREDLTQLFAMQEYRTATDGPEGAKALMIKRVIQAHDQAADAQLLKDSPGLDEAYRQRIADRLKALGAAPEQLQGITESLGR